jgi:hypothetical protein
MTLRWTPERLDQLERAVRGGLRVALSRRGTEFIVTAVRLSTVGRSDAFTGRSPMTGEEMVFPLHEIDELQILG